MDVAAGPDECGVRWGLAQDVEWVPRQPERISKRFLFKKAVPAPLDASRVRAYKAGHDDMRSDRHSNYMPGALTKTSRRDKVLEPSRRPTAPDFQHPVTKDVTHVF